MREVLTAQIESVPGDLRDSLTWDQGIKMRVRKTVGMDTGIDIHFWAPHASWQRIINKITTELLRQYSPKALMWVSMVLWIWTGSPPSSTSDHASGCSAGNRLN